MKSIVSFKIKLIMFFVLAILALLGLGYYYLNSMKTTQGNLNINKISMVNKLYTYDIYSDFYFRVAQYDDKGNKVAEYSELQPIKTSIGYDLEKKSSQPILNSILTKKLCLSETNATALKKYTNMMREFEKVFGKIVATQDEDYFKSSFKSTKEILKNLYNLELETAYSVDEYYTKIDNLPISNMRMKYFKLDKVLKNQKEEIQIAPNKKGAWQKNILEWNFGESDTIYLKYLMKWKNHDLKDFIDKTSKNKTVVNLIKINSNKIQNMYFIKYDTKNRIDTFFMDENGYVYVLIFKARNIASFEKYISDYLKIAYGISFKDTKNFENWFAEEQDKITKFNNIRVSFGVNLEKVDDEFIDKGVLGFNCASENEIILNIGKYTYHFDENEESCISSEKREVLTWNHSKNIYMEGKEYTIKAIENDLVDNDIYIGNSISFTTKNIEDINSGLAIRKDIGSNYFLEFQK